jgi:hypothetical protein
MKNCSLKTDRIHYFTYSNPKTPFNPKTVKVIYLDIKKD